MNQLSSKATWILGGLLACLCLVAPVQAKVVITFTGTVTDVSAFGATPPSGVAVGNPVSGTITYVPTAATAVEVGPGERSYFFPVEVEHLITITIGSKTWKSTLLVGVCDDVCDGDRLDFSGFSQTAADFPGLLDVGLAALEYSDSQAPYALLNGTDLPNSSEDIGFGSADLKSGTISSNSGTGLSLWLISFDLDSATLPARGTSWGTVKALYGKP